MADEAPERGDSETDSPDASTTGDAQWDGPSAWDIEDDASTSTATEATEQPHYSSNDGTRETTAEQDRFPLDLSRDESDAADEDESEDEDDPYGPEPSSTPVVAGDPDLENAVFVVLGAVMMLLVIARLVSLPL
ncbi:hypothetical protein G6M89_11550 [Natronolimnobius sp. AArcel1]|uniref:DUF7312 domain-containing protein n=1 Tax=Natronolimnobius sp. AArcel1 TaxID=1679093 RepID=UPI0013EE1565|nr:hypothetical protein [Natronolimnobius sp. AArcel1]NGM69633.1 hypothetical protein [Natronolimnobius sp. AArcel1]